MTVYTHGTQGGYSRGCRCDECTKAAREAQRRRRKSYQADRRAPSDERAYLETEPAFFHARLRAQS